VIPRSEEDSMIQEGCQYILHHCLVENAKYKNKSAFNYSSL